MSVMQYLQNSNAFAMLTPPFSALLTDNGLHMSHCLASTVCVRLPIEETRQVKTFDC